jgi:hypothetical protein
MTEQYLQQNINNKDGNGGGNNPQSDFSVNNARAYQLDGAIYLATGGSANPTGAFTGGGTGNKSIYGFFGFDNFPIANLDSIEFVWENVVGPAGPNFIPNGPSVTVTPYINLIVDFDPNGLGDLRVVVVISDQLNAAINASIGTYVNNGSNILTYSWNSNQNALIVLAPPHPVPGNVAPSVTVGASWLENSYSWQALVAANPDAVLRNAFPNDGGLPAGTVVPAVLLVSGDSGAVTKQGKKITSFLINGEEQVIP